MNHNRISYIDVEAGNPANVLYEHDAPVLDLGRLGTFDDCGVMPSWILDSDGKKYLYYIGWTVRNTIPYHNSIGLAISRDGGRTFERFSEGPLFGETYLEPFFTGTSCVLVERGIWKNWYLSCTGWTKDRRKGGASIPYQICRVRETESTGIVEELLRLTTSPTPKPGSFALRCSTKIIFIGCGTRIAAALITGRI